MAPRRRRLDGERPPPPRVPETSDAGPGDPRPRVRPTITLNADFIDFLAALLRADARFLIVGAHAMAMHGAPRATGDLDVWVAPDDGLRGQLGASGVKGTDVTRTPGGRAPVRVLYRVGQP